MTLPWKRPKGDPTTTDYWKTLGEEAAVHQWEQEHNLAPKESQYHIKFSPSGGGGYFKVTKGSEVLGSFWCWNTANAQLLDQTGKQAKTFLEEVRKYEAL